MAEWQRFLLNWYDQNRRDLPWRNTRDPYAIWISEVILQQTRIAQGLDYYHKFLARFPTVTDLANGEESAVLKTWQGLGYYSRARNLHKASKQVRDQYSGQFPDTREALLSLAGVGPYTASAVASIAFHQPHAVVDGNVIRVLSRFLHIQDDMALSTGRKKVEEAAEQVLVRDQPGDWNQALMELGATVCTPTGPKCTDCPVSAFCRARAEGVQEQLPVKSPKRKPRDRYIHYLAMDSPQGFALQRRTGNDIWRHLYEFPSWESKEPQRDPEVLFQNLSGWISGEPVLIRQSEVKHQLTHQTIHATFLHVRVPKITATGDVVFITPDTPIRVPVHRLMEKYLAGMGFIL